MLLGRCQVLTKGGMGENRSIFGMRATLARTVLSNLLEVAAIDLGDVGN